MNTAEIKEYIHREKPTAAYLGRIEMQAMVAEAESHAGFSSHNVTAQASPTTTPK
jgi:hypothetical protein